MPTVDVIKSCQIEQSFRVHQARGVFDLSESSESRFETSVEVPGLEEEWQIGLIVGPSGSGKSSVARQLLETQVWADALMVDHHDWSENQSVLDGFDTSMEGREVFSALNAVGFSSVPSWLRPYRVLSNGEQFRCDLARTLTLKQPVVVVDEFTSVVDRQVARFGSAAVSKMIRRGQSGCKRFVAVSCHYDILDWLTPDWWLDMANGQLARGCLQRPDIELHIRKAERDDWRAFARHHYLNGSLHPGARCYVACWDERQVAFFATINLYGQKRWRCAHRLVVLPDYQGLGVGRALLNVVAAHEADAGYRFSLVSSHPAMIRSLESDDHWQRRCVKRVGRGQVRSGARFGSFGRATVSYRYRGGYVGQKPAKL